MSESSYIHLRPTSKNALWSLAWALVFFVLINGVIWIAFDWKFFEWVGFDRLLMHPSDNEILSVIDKIRTDDKKKRIVLLGDSIIWGVGINDPQETLTGHLSKSYADREDIHMVNLSVPGNSFLDAATTIRAAYNENDVYLVFVNPMLFDHYYADRDFEEVVRFKELVQRNLREMRGTFKQCCGLMIPENTPWIARVDSVLFHIIPLYHNRDLITKSLIGLQPSIAVDALLNRMRKFSPSPFERKTMHIESDPVVEKESIDFTGSRMLVILRQVTELLQDKENVYYVILDDNRFKKNVVQDRNTILVKDAIASDHILDLYRKIPTEHFLDSVHMKPSGHALLADRIFRFLSQYDAP